MGDSSDDATALVGMPELVVRVHVLREGVRCWRWRPRRIGAWCTSCGVRAVGHVRSRTPVRDLPTVGTTTVSVCSLASPGYAPSLLCQATRAAGCSRAPAASVSIARNTTSESRRLSDLRASQPLTPASVRRRRDAIASGSDRARVSAIRWIAAFELSVAGPAEPVAVVVAGPDRCRRGPVVAGERVLGLEAFDAGGLRRRASQLRAVRHHGPGVGTASLTSFAARARLVPGLMSTVSWRMRSTRSAAMRAITVSMPAKRSAAMLGCLNVVSVRRSGSQVESI